MKILKILIASILITNLVASDGKSTLDILKDAKKKESYYEPSNKWAYLGLSIGIVFVASAVSVGILYAMPEEVTNWKKEDMKNIFKNYKKKVSKGPVVDSDELWLNYIAHPYFGALYYLQPRIAGFHWSESAFFSFLASTFFWEYGLESFAEVPSWQDIIITPAIGSILGEGFYRIIRYIQSNDNKLFGQWWLGKSVIWLLDPLGSLIYSTNLGELFGIHNKNSKIQFISTPILPNGKGGFQISFAMRF